MTSVAGETSKSWRETSRRGRMSASASLLHRRNPYRLWFAAGGALALALGGVGTTAALLGLVADDANVPRGTPAALAATNAALLLTSLVCWTRRELWLLRVLSLGVKSSVLGSCSACAGDALPAEAHAAGAAACVAAASSAAVL